MRSLLALPLADLAVVWEVQLGRWPLSSSSSFPSIDAAEPELSRLPMDSQLCWSIRRVSWDTVME